MSGSVRPSGLRSPQSAHPRSLTPTELTMETKTLFGSCWEEIYVCVQVCMSYHKDCFIIL